MAKDKPKVDKVKVKKLNRVYDGDTFYCDLKGRPSVLCSDIGIRVLGIDTPEIRGSSEREKRLAIKARERAEQLLSGRIKLRTAKHGKYGGRLVCSVQVKPAGFFTFFYKNFAEIMIKEGHAKKYDGQGRKPKWG